MSTKPKPKHVRTFIVVTYRELYEKCRDLSDVWGSYAEIDRNLDRIRRSFRLPDDVEIVMYEDQWDRMRMVYHLGGPDLPRGRVVARFCKGVFYRFEAIGREIPEEAFPGRSATDALLSSSPAIS